MIASFCNPIAKRIFHFNITIKKRRLWITSTLIHGEIHFGMLCYFVIDLDLKNESSTVPSSNQVIFIYIIHYCPTKTALLEYPLDMNRR